MNHKLTSEKGNRSTSARRRNSNLIGAAPSPFHAYSPTISTLVFRIWWPNNTINRHFSRDGSEIKTKKKRRLQAARLIDYYNKRRLRERIVKFIDVIFRVSAKIARIIWSGIDERMIWNHFVRDEPQNTITRTRHRDISFKVVLLFVGSFRDTFVTNNFCANWQQRKETTTISSINYAHTYKDRERNNWRLRVDGDTTTVEENRCPASAWLHQPLMACRHVNLLV